MRDSLLIILSKYMNLTTITLKFSVIVVEFIYTDTFAPPLSKSYLHPWTGCYNCMITDTCTNYNELSCPISYIRCAKKVWKPKMI